MSRSIKKQSDVKRFDEMNFALNSTLLFFFVKKYSVLLMENVVSFRDQLKIHAAKSF